MRRKLAGLLIAIITVEMLFSSVSFGIGNGGSGISGFIAEASELIKASPSNTLEPTQKETGQEETSKKTATSSQAKSSITVKKAMMKVEDGESNPSGTEAEVVLSLDKSEIQYGESVTFTMKNIEKEDAKELIFRVKKEGDEEEKRIVRGFLYESLDTEEKKGTLHTETLEIGTWAVAAYLNEEKVAESVLTITLQKYTLAFLKTVTKTLGRNDPVYLPSTEIVIKDKDGNQLFWSLSVKKILRKEGEELGVYEISGIETENEHVVYTVEQNEFAKLEILKLPVTNCSARYYIDANNKAEVTVDLINHKDASGKFSVPQDMKNSKIILGEIKEELKQCLNNDPIIDKNQVTVKLAVPVVKRSLQVPFIIKSDNYQDLTFVVDLQVDYLKERTKDEIKKFYKEHPFSFSESVTFDKTPSFSPYTIGKVSKKSETDGLNALNFVRFIAGIDADISIDDKMAYYAQAASVVMAKNGELSHLPVQPSDMPDDLYEAGAIGAGSSNIAYGWGTPQINLSKTVSLYMDDGDESNIDRVGHRRWCLNPGMKYTGFGFYKGYSALYTFDGSREIVPAVGYVSWPGKVMPYEYFEGPWSIHFSNVSYDVDENVKVVLKPSSGKSMSFSNDKSDGYFSFDEAGYGMGPAVIFKPSSSIKKNDTVEVQVTGLHRPDGTEAEIKYTVSFFSMSESTSSSSSDNNSTGGSKGTGGSRGGGGGGSGATNRTGRGVTGPGAVTLKTTGVYGYGGLWLDNGQSWNLLLSNGAFAESQWALVNNRWYIFDQNGMMLTGWQNVDNHWYYMAEDGAMLNGGWVLVNHKWYYLGADGAMYASTITPDGYQVNADGAWVVNGVVQTQ